MKPLRISVKNLGAIPSADVDLTGINLAAICGANGLGKSTMFTVAPRFALFGNLKPGTRVDDMVRTGASEMAVLFDFEHQSDVWRVIRTRSTKGKGKSTLELQRQSGELWASESGASIDETQKKIINLLNLTDETFVASSMILQGDAANFTARPAGQRKAILAQVLQLEQYEELQDKARARATALNLSIEKDKAMLASLEAKLADRADLESQLRTEEDRLAMLNVQADVKNDEIADRREKLAKMERSQQSALQYKKQFDDLQISLEQKKKDILVQYMRQEQAKTYLMDEQIIIANAERYEQFRDEAAILRPLEHQRNSIYKSAEQIKLELDRMDPVLEKICREVSTTELLLSTRPALERSAAEQDQAGSTLTAFDVAKQSHDNHTQRLNEVESEIRAKTHQKDIESVAKVKEIRIYEDRAAMLKDAGCVDIESANCKFLIDAKQANAKAKELQAAYDAWHDEQLLELHTLTGQRDGIIMSRDVIGYDAEAHAKAKSRYEEIMAKVLQLKSLEGAARLLDNLKNQQTELESRKISLSEQLQALRDEYKKISRQLAELPGLNQQMTELEPYLKKRDLLPAVRERLAAAMEQIAQMNAEIDVLDAKCQETHALYVDHVQNDNEIRAVRSAISMAEMILTEIQESIRQATLKIGALKAKLEGLDKDAIEHTAILERMDPLAKEVSRWWTLVKAFGRDGIPALIIENAVPELERIANDILGQMSGGKHSLRFETQRELKSRSGMAETLDIIVGDWSGERIYETFSGGEQLRIDFAIRFALAELLARRAGARVDWLTIDEGFGSQSDEYLPLVIEAVKSVANRFGMVLVISHVKQVQEAFDQQIQFRPAGEDVAVKVA